MVLNLFWVDTRLGFRLNGYTSGTGIKKLLTRMPLPWIETGSLGKRHLFLMWRVPGCSVLGALKPLSRVERCVWFFLLLCPSPQGQRESDFSSSPRVLGKWRSKFWKRNYRAREDSGERKREKNRVRKENEMTNTVSLICPFRKETVQMTPSHLFCSIWRIHNRYKYTQTSLWLRLLRITTLTQEGLRVLSLGGRS